MLKVYIYNLKDENDNIFYVGQTIHPRQRLGQHTVTYGRKIYMEILEETTEDKKLELEAFYIKLLTSWGFKLANKQKSVISQSKQIYSLQNRLDASNKRNRELIADNSTKQKTIEEKEQDILRLEKQVRRLNRIVANKGFFKRVYKVEGDAEYIIKLSAAKTIKIMTKELRQFIDNQHDNQFITQYMKDRIYTIGYGDWFYNQVIELMGKVSIQNVDSELYSVIFNENDIH